MKPKKSAAQLDREISLALLRDARKTGEDDAAVDFLLERGYPLHRAKKATSDYVGGNERFTSFTVSPEQRQAVGNLRARWGSVEDYYPDEDEADDRRDQWNEDRKSWIQEIKAALKATTRAQAREALESASSVENEWGDNPQTVEIANLLGIRL